MRNQITIFLLIAALCLAWQYHEMSDGKAAAEARVGELNAESESLRAELKSASAQIKQFGGQPGAQPGAKPNWVEEKNRKYQSPLTGSPGAPGGPGKGRPLAGDTLVVPCAGFAVVGWIFFPLPVVHPGSPPLAVRFAGNVQMMPVAKITAPRMAGPV